MVISIAYSTLSNVTNSPEISKGSTTNICSRVCNAAKKTFDFIENKLWDYTKNVAGELKFSLLLAKDVLKAKIPENIGSIFGKASCYLGMASAISLAYTVKNFPGTVEKAIKNYNLKDVEGSIFATIGIAMDILDATSSTASTNSALNRLGAMGKIGFLDSISSSLGIILLTYFGSKGFYDAGRQGWQLFKMPKEVSEDSLEDVKRYLDRKTEVIHRAQRGDLSERDIQVIKGRKLNRLERRTDKKVVALMQNLRAHLVENPDDVATTNLALQDMRTLMKRKITVGCASSSANLGFAGAIFANTVYSADPNILFGAGIARHSIMLGKLAYNETLFTRGLNLPDFINPRK